jgi:aminopeptidase-like protein
LGKRGLYNISSNDDADSLINFLAYVDGSLDLMDISNIIKINIFDCHLVAEILLKNHLIEVKNEINI